MATKFTSSVGIESNVYPMDVSLDVDQNFLSNILDGAALYALKNNPDIMVLPNQYKFTERQNRAYNSYAIKCSHTEPDDNPHGLDSNGRTICRCINTFCESFKRCRDRTPFDYNEMAIRFGFEHDEGSIRNVVIFDDLFNKLSDENLIKLASELNVEKKGFTSFNSMLANNPALFKNKLKLVIKKRVRSDFQTKNDYAKLYENDELNFYKVALIDLFNNYNSEIIEDILVELKIIDILPHVDQGDKSLTDQVIKELKDKIDELEKLNKQIVSTNRDLKKQNDSLIKKQKELREDNYNKLKAKDDTLKSIELERDRLNNKLANLQDEINKQKDLIMQRNAVLEIIYGKKRVLLVNIKVNDKSLMPYEYNSVTLDQIPDFSEAKGQYSDVWIPHGTLPDIYIDDVKKRLESKLGKVIFIKIKENELEKIGLEVLQ